MKLYRVVAAVLLTVLPAAAQAEIPASIRTMLDAAIASGNDGEINVLVKYAKNTHPEAAPEIDALVNDYRDRKTTAAKTRVREADFLELWDGQADLGGSRSTGNTDTLGVTAGFYLAREGEKWRHKLRARGDYQENDNIVTREALLVAYEPSYKIDDRLFIYGLGQVERDTFLGYARRISLSSGAGYRVVAEPNLTIDLDAGPAYRATRFVGGNDEQTLAGRGSLNVKWRLAPTVNITNNTSAYVEDANSTLVSTTSLDTKLIGPLSARLSYNVNYEQNPPFGRENVDTLSRAALVYDF